MSISPGVLAGLGMSRSSAALAACGKSSLYTLVASMECDSVSAPQAWRGCATTIGEVLANTKRLPQAPCWQVAAWTRFDHPTLSASQPCLALATRECVFLGRGAVRGESRAVPTRPAGKSRRAGRTTTGNG
eukprot:scaffold52037_cov63-Phaeocystis_antarctica.AAC.2